MSVYSIADLEKLSGVKAHTIRIWEKRYNIVEPNRTDSNIRFYDDFQLKRILNISFLIRHGLKISKIAKLDNQDIELKVREKSVVSSDSELFINDIIVSTLTFDKDLFESTFARSLKVFGFDQMYESVLIPSLNKIGFLWSSGELFPAQEHFLSNMLKQKLYSMLDGINPEVNTEKTVLLFLPPWENHDFALIFSDIVLQSLGFNVINIGKSISIESIYECIKKIQPDFLFTTVIVGHKINEIQSFCDGIAKNNEKGKLTVAGNVDLLKLVRVQGKVFSGCAEFREYYKNLI